MMLSKMKLIVTASALCLAAAGGLALAKGHDPAKKAAMMQKFDANGDGALDDAERGQMKQAFASKRAARKAARIARFDADKDGALSPAERAAMKDQRARDRFAKLDTNGDGKLSLDEFKTGRAFGHGRHGGGRHGGGGGAGQP
ncbi:MAG TPA: EF-hand domain-containing protein [Kofleriaceae bacterium]|nr:EF-hand domain-containing protein [Kofleriaceae bacterium]